MSHNPTLFKDLLVNQHRQKYETFCLEYDKAARTLGDGLRHSQPSRAQYYRWLSGQLKGGLPYPDACRVLEVMFPGWTAEQLFRPRADDERGPAVTNTKHLLEASRQETEVLSGVVQSALTQPSTDAETLEWGGGHNGFGTRAALTISVDSADAISRTSRPGPTAKVVAERLADLQRVKHLSHSEVLQLGALAGQIVDLDYTLRIDIDRDGLAIVRAHQELLNLTARPVARFVRDFWFEHTRSAPTPSPLPRDDGRHLAIQRMHEAPSLTKFACQLSPAVQPGESAVIGYSCSGGQFVDQHYWRQSVPRFTRRFNLTVRHAGVRPLIQCTAVEEAADGSEVSATEALVWGYEGDDVSITLTRDYLRPNDSVTLRWEVTHDS